MNGVLKKNPLGFVTMDRRQLVIVSRMGNPFEAFSMIALRKNRKLLLLLTALLLTHSSAASTGVERK